MRQVRETKVGPEGRILIPADIRRAVGMRPGTSVIIEPHSEGVLVLPVNALKRQVQAMFADVEGSMAEELIAARHHEARRDAATG